ncbi:MAG: molybdopterin-dependent oxidoreductase, partial [Deltaproteobacteria bacterium]|nr:molybdopterin-dependent oxidoreductase [Deltaproteobacteria bacterium]
MLASMLGGAAAVGCLPPRQGRPDLGDRGTIFTGEYLLDDPEQMVFSTCLGCHAACPTRVVAMDGIIAKIDGNPFCPRVYNAKPPADRVEAAKHRGVLCARGQARLQNTHDPHRLEHPLMREGARGSGRWVSVGPDEVRAALVEVGDADPLIAVDPRHQDRVPVLRAFAGALGGVHMGDPVPWVRQATATLLGAPGWVIEPRWERAEGVLVWGADPLASGIDQVRDSFHINRLRARGAPIVVVDPRLSTVGGFADLWLPVRPGGDMALAWMMLRAWYEQGRFVGPEQWMETVLLRPLPDLELRAGLGYEVARRAAEALGAVGPTLAIRVGGGVGERPSGTDVTEAILRLAAVSGATAPGGAMEPMWAPEPIGARPVDRLAEIFDAGGRVEVLVVVGDGGIVDSPRNQELLAALSQEDRVGLLVSVATAMNPVAALADLVVPDLTEHERHGLVVRHDGVSLVQPSLPASISPVFVEAEVVSPWDRGLEGLLQVFCDIKGIRLDCEAALSGAIEATGVAGALRERGWAAPPDPKKAPPPADPFRRDASRSPGVPAQGLALVTFREAFGGFVDSTAQYWATPSLRRHNEAWIHPETAAELGLGRARRVEVRAEGEGASEVFHLQRTGAVRRNVVALAVGYGHREGYDGNLIIDGRRVTADARRHIGSKTG